MPDGSQKKISELPVAPAAHPTDLLETSQADGTGYVSRSITLAQVAAGVVAPPAWTDITGKPATFPPTVPIAYTDISGKPSTFPPDPEAIDDRVAALLVAGTNITLAYNDPANTLTINSTASGGAPSGAAGGDLSGTYPNPTVKSAAGAFAVTGALTGTTATMSGDIAGVTGTFSGNVIGSSFFAASGGGMFNNGTTSGVLVGGGQAYNQGAVYVAYGNAGGNKHDWTLNGFVTKMTLDTNGLALSTPLTGTTATFSGTVSAPGAQIQMVFTETGAVATGTTIMPIDDTIPQITEGDQYMTLAITPRSATSKLVIEVIWTGTSTAAANAVLTLALFQDAGANALAANFAQMYASSAFVSISLRHMMTSGTTSATTFRVRVGAGTAGTTTFNGGSSARLMGGALASSIVIREVA